MKVLLDTHTLIWFLNGDKNISLRAIELIEDTKNIKFISIASIWEIAIKISIDKLRFENGFEAFLNLIIDSGFEILPINFDHVLTVSRLEFIHRDPFDRLIIAQSKNESIPIITIDDKIKLYQVKTIW